MDSGLWALTDLPDCALGRRISALIFVVGAQGNAAVTAYVYTTTAGQPSAADNENIRVHVFVFDMTRDKYQ